MVKKSLLIILPISICMLLGSHSAAAAKFMRYLPGAMTKVVIDVPIDRTPIEDKRFFNCDQFLFTEKDVHFAMRHRKQVSERYFDHQTVSIGCYGGATMTFRNGATADMLIELERFSVSPKSGKYKGKTFYFTCMACARSKSFARNPAYKSD